MEHRTSHHVTAKTPRAGSRSSSRTAEATKPPDRSAIGAPRVRYLRQNAVGTRNAEVDAWEKRAKREKKAAAAKRRRGPMSERTAAVSPETQSAIRGAFAQSSVAEEVQTGAIDAAVVALVKQLRAPRAVATAVRALLANAGVAEAAQEQAVRAQKKRKRARQPKEVNQAK